MKFNDVFNTAARACLERANGHRWFGRSSPTFTARARSEEIRRPLMTGWNHLAHKRIQYRVEIDQTRFRTVSRAAADYGASCVA